MLRSRRVGHRSGALLAPAALLAIALALITARGALCARDVPLSQIAVPSNASSSLAPTAPATPDASIRRSSIAVVTTAKPSHLLSMTPEGGSSSGPQLLPPVVNNSHHHQRASGPHSNISVEGEVGSAPGDYAAVRASIIEVINASKRDNEPIGPTLLRLSWHSSGSYSKYDHTGGSNGARIRFHPEKDYANNRGLAAARDALQPVKAAHPWITYADLYTYAGAVAVEAMGGPVIPWRPGRTDDLDGHRSRPIDDRLPNGTGGATHVWAVFSRLGFDARDTVALIGAHAVGECRPENSGFDGQWTDDPQGFDNGFFTELLNETWVPRNWTGPRQFQPVNGSVSGTRLMMLPTDMALLNDDRYRPHVEEFAAGQDTFFRAFASAFSRLLELGTNLTSTPVGTDQQGPV